MNVCRYDVINMLDAVLSSLYVLCGHWLPVMMTYVAVAYTLVDTECVVSTA